MKQLDVGKSGRAAFKIPADFVTQTAAVLARKGAGKTYTASVLAEGLLNAGQQLVVLDPLDAWWGLRSSADGKGEGHPVVVFGGAHGDLPLDEKMGKRLADYVAEEPGLSCVLSLRHLRKNRQRQFAVDFLEQLFHRKGETKLATAVHLMADEADMFAPQRVMGDTARLFGAMDDIVRRGRQAGIGITMICQRSAALNKDVLTQVELLVVGQMTGPHDKKAIQEWIKHNASDAAQASFMTTLAELAIGEFWFWSPSWLRCMKKVRVRKRATFDSSATPKAGKRPKAPKKMAEVDLEKLKGELATVIKEAQEKDPKVLRRRIAELEREAAKAKPVGAGPTPVEIARQVKEAVAAAITDRDAEWRKEREELAGLVDEVSGHLAGADKALRTLATKVVLSGPPVPRLTVNTKALARQPAARRPAPRAPAPPAPRPRADDAGDTRLSRCERALLTVLAQRERACSKRLVALQSGYSVKSSGFSNALSSLRTKGLITRGREPAATAEGIAALGEFDPLPAGEELVEHWKGKLAKAPRAIFTALASAYPAPLTREEIAERTGYSLTSSGFSNALSTLRTLELIERADPMTVNSEIFG